MSYRITRRAVALLAGLLTLGTAQATHLTGPYQSDVTAYEFEDLAGTPMAAIVFYPLSMADGSPLPAGETYEVSLFMQGGNVNAYNYAWLRALAAQGHIVVLPDIAPVSATSLNDDTRINTNTKLTSVEILDQAVKELHVWAANPDAEIFGRFNGKVAVAGHSLGAVISMAAMDVIACIDAIIPRCPPGYTAPHPSIVAMWMIGGHLENPNGPPATRLINKPANFPVYMIAGSEDGASTVTEVQTSYRRYRAPKVYYEIAGANHFQWVDYPTHEDDDGDDLPASIHPLEQQAQTVAAVHHFLKCYIDKDWGHCAQLPSTAVPPAP